MLQFSEFNRYLCCNFGIVLDQANIWDVRKIKVNGVEIAENCRRCRKDLLVWRLLPEVILDTAAKINGVTSLPLIPARLASANAFAMELLMTSSFFLK